LPTPKLPHLCFFIAALRWEPFAYLNRTYTAEFIFRGVICFPNPSFSLPFLKRIISFLPTSCLPLSDQCNSLFTTVTTHTVNVFRPPSLAAVLFPCYKSALHAKPSPSNSLGSPPQGLPSLSFFSYPPPQIAVHIVTSCSSSAGGQLRIPLLAVTTTLTFFYERNSSRG